ncbi:hypothetical protein L195_g060967, partial [Trifolium pratense]
MNPVLHGRSKHIDVRFYFLRDLTKDGVVKLIHCSTQDQIADIMTKALKLESFCSLGECLLGSHSLQAKLALVARASGLALTLGQ